MPELELALRDLPVGAEVDRELIFAADSPRELTQVETEAIAALEAWAYNPSTSWREITGSAFDKVYDDVMSLISAALASVYRENPARPRDGASRLEAAQRIREGSVRGAQ